MRVFGIICEYNPFHRGHKWQIDELRRLAGEEECAVVCAMSGDFVQRGDFAIERAHARRGCRARGADLVLELPLPWAISSAEGFARGGVSILAATGVVDTLAFGSECGNAAKLQRAAKALLRADFPDALREELAKGLSFAAARESAARALIGEDAAVLREPNDILGVEYCKGAAAKRQYHRAAGNIAKGRRAQRGCGEGLRLGEPHPRAAHERRGRLRVSDGGERRHLCARMRSGPRAGDDAECGASGAFPAARDVRRTSPAMTAGMKAFIAGFMTQRGRQRPSTSCSPR